MRRHFLNASIIDASGAAPIRGTVTVDGAKIAILGLGGAVLSYPTTVDELCDLIHAVLADREVQQQVMTASKLVRKQSATDRAIDLISQVVTRRFGGAVQE